MSALRNEIASRWQALGSRERVLVGAAAALGLAALVWWIGLSPALAKIKQARQAAPQLDAQLQLMRAQAQEATGLKSQRLLSYDESLRSLEAAVKTLGTSATLTVQDARASVTLKGASGDALAQWLAQVRANARLVPTELRLQKSPTAAASNPAGISTSTSTSTSAITPAPATLWDGAVILNLPAR